MYDIVVENLKKEFRVSYAKKGSFYQNLKQFFIPNNRTISAVKNLNFSIKKGERVAFIGPNGAGKSTTIKILTGILKATEGRIEVLGKDPFKSRESLSYNISAIFGQVSKLWNHLPVQESLDLLAAIYDLPLLDYHLRLNDLVEKFKIEPLLSKPLRMLSLGERMRCEIVAGFLHKPEVIFLDEPTIGLDVTAKAIIRDLLRHYSKTENVTLLLTSHDTDDIETVCDRVIMIDKGFMLLDDNLHNLKKCFIKKKTIQVATEEDSPTWNQEGVEVLEKLSHHLKLEVDLAKYSTESVVSAILKKYTVKDITIEDPSLETIIRNFYQCQTNI